MDWIGFTAGVEVSQHRVQPIEHSQRVAGFHAGIDPSTTKGPESSDTVRSSAPGLASSGWSGVREDSREEVAELGGGEADGSVCRSVVEPDLAAAGVVDEAAWEDHVRDVSGPLVCCDRGKNPLG